MNGFAQQQLEIGSKQPTHQFKHCNKCAASKPRRRYSDEFKQVVLRPLLGIKSLKKAKEFLAKCR